MTVCRKHCAFLPVFLFVSLFIASFAYAENSAANNDKEKKKIHITSNSLVADNEARIAEFIGNVEATMGTDVIISDKLKIYYKKGVDKKEKTANSQESIEKIVANGKVTIKFDDKIATTQQAVYTAKTGVVVLTGPNSKVTSGENSISGEKITIYRSDDRMIVESSSEKQVEAIFYSKDNSMK